MDTSTSSPNWGKRAVDGIKIAPALVDDTEQKTRVILSNVVDLV